jgi:hypothetical protein
VLAAQPAPARAVFRLLREPVSAVGQEMLGHAIGTIDGYLARALKIQ